VARPTNTALTLATDYSKKVEEISMEMILVHAQLFSNGEHKRRPIISSSIKSSFVCNVLDKVMFLSHAKASR
jgi:hypothetical protein